jgi:hypothetical protein
MVIFTHCIFLFLFPALLSGACLFRAALRTGIFARHRRARAAVGIVNLAVDSPLYAGSGLQFAFAAQGKNACLKFHILCFARNIATSFKKSPKSQKKRLTLQGFLRYNTHRMIMSSLPKLPRPARARIY